MTLILHKRSNTHLKVPLVSDLSSGELSINTYDGRLFIKKTVSSVDSIVTISNDYADLINTPTFSTNYGVTVTTVGTVITIGTPQDLQTTASPTFAGATINGDLTIVNNANTWTFNSDGEIQLPSGGDIVDSSGASVLGGGGGSGGGLSPTPIKTSAYTAVANDLVRCNSTASSFSVTLPLNPPDGAIIGITDVDSKFAEHPVTLLPNTGKTIENNTGVILDINGTYISVVYVLADLNWKILETPIIHHDGALNSTAIISNNYVASGNDLVRCDSFAASFSITFPGAPVDGSIIGIVDSSNSFATHNVTLYSNTGKTIDGNTSQVLSTNGMYISFIYIDSSSTWRSLGASTSPIADQTGNNGKLLTTNGAITSWLSTTGSGSAVLATSPAIATSITTASTSFNLINTTATTVNFAGAATSIGIGTNTGTTTINHNLQVAGTITGTLTGTATGLSTTLVVGSGGTGATTLAANNVLLGNGTSALQVVAPGTTGNVLTSDGTTWSSQPAPISLPSQTGNATKYLTTDGTTASWGTISRTVEVLKRDGTTVSTVSLTTGYLAVLNRSSTTIQVSIT
jgi:hypothetical protein